MRVASEHPSRIRIPSCDRRAQDFLEEDRLAPVGRFKLTVCTNLPCALRHADRAAQYLQRELGVGFGQTTADGMFTLREGECMGACADAPVLLVNDTRMESFCDEAKIDGLLGELRALAPQVKPGNRVD